MIKHRKPVLLRPILVEMAKNLYGYGLDFENLYGRNTTDYTGIGHDVC